MNKHHEERCIGCKGSGMRIHEDGLCTACQFRRGWYVEEPCVGCEGIQEDGLCTACQLGEDWLILEELLGMRGHPPLGGMHCPHCGQVPQKTAQNICMEEEKILQHKLHNDAERCLNSGCAERREHFVISRCEHCAGYFQIYGYIEKSCIGRNHSRRQIEKL